MMEENGSGRAMHPSAPTKDLLLSCTLLPWRRGGTCRRDTRRSREGYRARERRTQKKKKKLVIGLASHVEEVKWKVGKGEQEYLFAPSENREIDKRYEMVCVSDDCFFLINSPRRAIRKHDHTAIGLKHSGPGGGKGVKAVGGGGNKGHHYYIFRRSNTRI